MSLIKIISYPRQQDVEEAFEKWVLKTKCTVLEIKYSIAEFENELWYSLAILYEPGKSE